MREVREYNRRGIGKNECDVKEKDKLKEYMSRGVNLTCI
jgi:hypothetical protein